MSNKKGSKTAIVAEVAKVENANAEMVNEVAVANTEVVNEAKVEVVYFELPECEVKAPDKTQIVDLEKAIVVANVSRIGKNWFAHEVNSGLPIKNSGDWRIKHMAEGFDNKIYFIDGLWYAANGFTFDFKNKEYRMGLNDIKAIIAPSQAKVRVKAEITPEDPAKLAAHELFRQAGAELLKTGRYLRTKTDVKTDSGYGVKYVTCTPKTGLNFDDMVKAVADVVGDAYTVAKDKGPHILVLPKIEVTEEAAETVAE